MDPDEAEWPGSLADERQGELPFYAESSLFPSATQPSLYPSILSTAALDGVSYPEKDSYGVINSRHQAWDNPGESKPPTGDFVDDISSASEIEEEVDDSSSESSFDGSSTDGYSASKGSNTTFKKTQVTDRLHMNVSNVIKSRFTNHSNETGDMTIRLTCGQESTSGEAHDLFRWIHLHNEVTDFGAFIEKSLQASQISRRSRKKVKRKLKDIQKSYERSTYAQDGTEGSYMEPFVYQDVPLGPAGPDSHPYEKITVINFPFFLLDEPNKEVELLARSNNPPFTLLQTMSPSIPVERDLHQAVCTSHPSLKKQCFHVSQLWGCIIDDKYLFTCTRLTERKFFGNVITLAKKPTTGDPFIKVTDGGNCIWQFTISECETWFGFIAHFMEIGLNRKEAPCCFEDMYDVTWNGRSIQPGDWADVVAHAKKTSIQLVLSRRTEVEQIQVIQASHSRDSADITRSEGQTSSRIRRIHTAPPGLSLTGTSGRSFTPPITTRDFEPTTYLRDNKEPMIGENHQDVDLSRRTADVGVKDHEEFHALAWFAQRSGSIDAPSSTLRNEKVPVDGLQGLLTRINDRLLKRGSRCDREAYGRSDLKLLPDVTSYLLSVTRDSSQKDGYISTLSTLDTFFVAAVQVFELFLDLTDESEVAQRYWGSVHYILKDVLASPEKSESDFNSIIIFKRISYLANIIRKELAQPHGPRPGSIDLPPDFGKAWIHCLQVLTLFKSVKAKERDLEDHAEKCEALLHRGRQALWRAWTKVPLQAKEVASPLALFMVIIGQIQKDISKSEVPPNIAHVYREHWKRLIKDVKAGRLKRSLPRFDPLQQEIGAVLKTLEHQVSILIMLNEKILEQSTGWSSFHSATLQNALRPEIPLLHDCFSHIEDRIQLFRTILEDSKNLEKWTDEHLTAFQKDRHDNAIYVFTIFTVIFLPLSFVCSFLGMNTADVRNTTFGQSLFWAAALPLTFVVVLIALMVTDELDEVWITLRDKFGLPVKYLGFTPRLQRESYWKKTSGAEAMLKNIAERKKPKSEQYTSAVAPIQPIPAKRKTKDEKIKKLHQRAPTFGSVVE